MCGCGMRKLIGMPTARPTEKIHRGALSMVKTMTHPVLCSRRPPAKEAGFQMLADNIATTHPFVREEPCETEQAPVAYFVAAQRLHKLQGQREKLVNQLVAHEERRKDLVKRLDETARLEVLAQDELDQALARQRNNTTPDSLEIPVLSQKDLAILDDTEQQDYLAAVEADKGFKAHLGATTARTEMHRDKSQAAQASKKEEPQQKKPRWAAEQAMEVDGSDEGSKASEAYRTKVAAHTTPDHAQREKSSGGGETNTQKHAT